MVMASDSSSMAMASSSMAMPSSTASAPLTTYTWGDPRCVNDTCAAFKAVHVATQAQISWASQFVYGKYVTYFYVACIGVFAFIYCVSLWKDRRTVASSADIKPTFANKCVAFGRSITYRRLSGKLGKVLELPSLGVILFLTLALVYAFAISFAQRPYYRPARGTGSPPLAVRTGMAAVALVGTLNRWMKTIKLTRTLDPYHVCSIWKSQHCFRVDWDKL
jgi:hypothetical protein